MLPFPFDLLPSSAVRSLSVRTGDFLFHEGDKTIGLFVPLNTSVHLIRTGHDGEATIIHRASAGTWFAEASIFSETYHCDAVAKGEGEVLKIEKAAVLRGMQDPLFATSFCHTISGQLQSLRQIREILAIRSAQDRVFAGLVAGLLVGTVVDFASTISLSQEATFRALRRLVKQGKIENRQRGSYKLTDS